MRILGQLPREVLQGAIVPLPARPRRATVLRDALLWLVFGGLVGLGALAMGRPAPVDAWSIVVAVVVAGVIVALGRPLPVVALLVAVVASGWNFAFGIPTLVAAYWAGRRMPRMAATVVALDVIAVVGVAFAIVNGAADWTWWVNSVAWYMFFLVLPWLLGIYRRQQWALADAGWQHAAQLEREQRIARAQARLRERSRIAQDMHDSLGHELSMIALRAGALEVAGELDDRHRQAAGELRSHATSATERLQEIIGILRERSEPVPLDPAGGDVQDLVARARASGVEVSLARTGQAADPPDMIARAVYRVVQEAMTNATKHAPGAAVTVTVHHDSDQTEVRVSNEPGDADTGAAAGSGSGLVALSERVRLAGGQFEAGTRPDGGFDVRARFGHHAAAVQDAAGEEPEGASVVAAAMRAAQQRSRRGFIAMATVGGATVAAFFIAGIGLAASDMFGSLTSVSQAQFDGVSVGDHRDEVEAALPEDGLVGPMAGPEDPPPPPGAICSYYLVTEGLYFGNEFYRFCYDDDVLVAKDVVRTADTPGADVEAG